MDIEECLRHGPILRKVDQRNGQIQEEAGLTLYHRMTVDIIAWFRLDTRSANTRDFAGFQRKGREGGGVLESKTSNGLYSVGYPGEGDHVREDWADVTDDLTEGCI